MAALSESAQAARAEAKILRGRARELTQLARSNLDRSHRQLQRAQAQTCRARAQLLEPLPSPWSGLYWKQPHEMLEQTLVSLS